MNQSVFDTILSYTSRSPVDIYGLASALEIDVKERDMQIEQSGSIEKKNGRYLITVNKTHSANRKRFTVAHEIGHFIFHSDLIDQGAIFDDKLYRDKRVGDSNEAQANRFAASVLMPEKLIQQLVNRGIDTVEGLARALNVSEDAMQIRAKNLRLIPQQKQFSPPEYETL